MAEGTEGVTAYPTSAHWGAFEVLVRDGRVVGVRPDPGDPAPSPVIANTVDAQYHPTRVARPAVRRRWLERGPGPDPRRGDPDDEYVALDWDTALDLVAAEVDRVRREHGNAAIFGGSYGWASAGRFHHAQSQLHRFLNTVGGYTRSVTTYSHGAAEVLLPHVVGAAGAHDLLYRPPTWEAIAEHTDLLVSFGGLRVSNTWVSSGGRAAHTAEGGMREAARRGTEFVSVSPLRDDTAAELGARWVSAAPGTDTAILLALIHVLVVEGLADTAFLDRYTVGWPRLRGYVLGEGDGVPKTPEWAAALSGVAAAELRALARRMARGRTLVNVGWSVQRARYGEQPLWAGLALAACLGQIGLPGGGFATGYGSMGNYGGGSTPGGLPRLPQGRNPVDSLIPVARVADMLLHPGEPFDFDGRRLRYPDVRLVYWAGGNPFHHHQDLARLRRAFARPDTVVVNETHWTATARHADVVFPVTTTLEREDFAASNGDLRLRVMRRAVPPHGAARDEYAVFTGLAERLGVAEEFTEGRDARQWLRHLYEEWRQRQGPDSGLADFDGFWAAGGVDLPNRVADTTLFGEFRADPLAHPLGTPSGRIELYSETVAGFRYPDCPGHPVWLDPPERPGTELARRWPLTLVANQPRERLHSQQDMGAYSRAGKVADRAPVRLHPDDAAARGIANGDVVRLYNDRGSCLAGAVLDDGVRPGVVQLSTGAWFDPSSPEATCVHGNPNAVTADVGTSRLAQGCTGQLALVQVERFDGTPPPVRAFVPPRIVDRAE
ncbi:molybdopterin guanine dinucleotide-containing S/N-oxide reductase [Thermobifida cellulosilytica]|uniref:Molybdopterin oxidoreductase n=1 Tax=Thermobifida cellulosilytica TB100 TaxID=665004 RepID=A0A147KDU0_THECS|nr:molybdopterin guanine dinucleotide-containing S/N-oxide reductase [Thermobifida cellulosilytica]KUP95440.1 molybdopterin oxidoreductase [Thermobifida cellulosilytica TB100]